jgi:hypothetical protein
MKRFRFSRWSFNYRLISDIICVKAGTTIATLPNLLGKVKAIVGGRVSKGFYSNLLIICNTLRSIQKSQGNSGLILYLKAAQVALQQACSGYKVKDMRPLGARISRSRSYLPRLIPSSHRLIILNRSAGYTLLIKFYLTLFYIYRVIVVPKYKVNLSTIINKGVEGVEQVVPLRFYRHFIDSFIGSYMRLRFKGNTISMAEYFERAGRFFTILKSSPMNFTTEGQNLWSTHPLVMFRSLVALVHSDYYDDFMTLAQAINVKLRKLITAYSLSARLAGRPGLASGKLSFKEEAAGKLRVFAIVDCYTQWLLYPLHKLIFSILRRVPMDGTFNQLKPVHRLLRRGAKSFYSLDLSAATDRLPIIIQERLLNEWLSSVCPNFGTLWRNILVNRDYHFKAPRHYDTSKHGAIGKVRYAVGQPMGALSSWAMLALTHHFVVQVSAWHSGLIRPGQIYKSYALLGDDLVICDKCVADAYLSLMDKLGVSVNLNKSILSPKGLGLEFAKRTFINGVDVSPISFRDLSLATQPGALSHWAAFAKAQNLSLLRQAHILGYGYQAVKTSFRKMNHALKVVYLANIAKVDFNSDVLNLVRRVPIDLNVNVGAFKDKVLRPFLRGMDSPVAKVYHLFDELPSIYSTWLKSHEGHVKYVTEWILKNKKHSPVTQQELMEINSGLYLFMYFVHKRICKEESPIIFRKLGKALAFMKVESYETLNECLSAYLTITRMVATQSVDILRLSWSGVTPKSVRLPFQARLFRAWSRTVVRLAKLSKDNSESKTPK